MQFISQLKLGIQKIINYRYRFYKLNYIYLNGKRVFHLFFRGNIIFSSTGSGNIININTFHGKGVLYISMDSYNSKFEFGIDNTIDNYLYILYPAQSNMPCKGNVFIGNFNCFHGKMVIISPFFENNAEIGNNNLFAHDIEINARSDHSIFDKDIAKRLNIEYGVKIGNHIWLCKEANILNKSVIYDNSVIGMRSVTNRDFQECNCLIAGVPAQVKKRNITWDIITENNV